MSQTKPHTNNGQNWYQNFGRGGQVQGLNPGSGCGNCCNNHGDKSITKYSFKGKMKDGPISELTITETGHRPSQFKKLYDALPVFCADKTRVASMKSSVPDMTKSKMTSCRLILTPPYGLIHTKYKSPLSLTGPP